MASLTNSIDVLANVVETQYLYVNGEQITAAGMVGSAGSIANSYLGAWNDETVYAPNDVVVYGGSSFVCLAQNGGTPPQEGEFWGILAQAGADGATGATGAPGATGAQGPAGATGPQGPAGANATILGSYRGVWSDATTYQPNDVVVYSESGNSTYSCYLATAASANQPPPAPGNTSSFWAFLAVHGSQGEQGPRGWTGERGPQGEPGADGKDGKDGADASPVDVGSIILAVVGGTAFVTLSGRVSALELYNTLTVTPTLLTHTEAIASLETKTFFQSANQLTGNTSFRGNSLTMTSGNGLSSAVSLNASSAASFSLGAVVNGGLTCDQATVNGAFNAPGMTISANGLNTTIGSGPTSTITIGNSQQLSTIYLNGRVLMPSRDAELDSFGFARVNGFLSQF